MNTCILCCYQPHIYEYASILSKKEGFDIKLVETIPNTIDWKNHYFPQAKSYDFFDLLNIYHRKDIEIKKAPKYIIDEVNVKTMLSRNLVELFPSEILKTKIINSYFTYWDNIFRELKPQHLIFEEEPHQLVNYICYLIAKKKKINIQMFIRTVACTSLGLIWVKDFDQNNKIFSISSIKKLKTKKLSLEKKQIINKISNSSHKEMLKINLSDHELIEDKNKSFKSIYTNNNLLNIFSKFSKLPKHDIISNIEIPSAINPYIAFFLRKAGNIKKKINYSYYKNKSSKNKINYNKKNIILLLQFQPEKSTSPLGGEFCDQLKLIQFISENINEEYNLLVKEHPSQFSLDYCRYFERHRSISFYKQINLLKNTYLIPLYFDIFSLPKDTIYISVTGTVILEAALRGLPAICLGNKWYDQMPTICNIKTYKKLKGLLKSLNLVSQKVNKIEAIDYLKKFISAVDNEESIGGEIRPYPESMDFYHQKGLGLYKVYKNCKSLFY